MDTMNPMETGNALDSGSRPKHIADYKMLLDDATDDEAAAAQLVGQGRGYAYGGGERSVYPPTPGNVVIGSQESGGDDEDFTVSEALDIIGIGPMQYRLLFVVAIASLATGMTSTGFAMFPAIARCHHTLSSVQEAMLTSVCFLGMAIGGYIFALIGAIYGRRIALVSTCVWLAYFQFLGGFSPGYYWLLFLRFVVGFAIGGTVQRLALVVENLSAKHRALPLAFIALAFRFGNFMETFFIKNFIETGVSVQWRYVLFADSTFYAMAFVFSMWMFESPYWLFETAGRRVKATRHLVRAAELNGKSLPNGGLISDQEQQETKITPFTSELASSADQTGQGFGIETQPIPGVDESPLHQPRRPYQHPGKQCEMRDALQSRQLVIVFFTHMTLAIAYLGHSLLTEELLLARQAVDGRCVHGFSAYNGSQCRYLSAEEYRPILLIFALEIPSLILMYGLADFLGRRQTVAFSFFLAGLSFALLIMCPLSFPLTIVFLSVGRVMLTMAMSVLTIHSVDVYPEYVRSMATGLGNVGYCAGGIAAPFLAQVLFRHSMSASLGTVSALCLLTSVMCLMFPKETAKKNLDDQ